MSSTPTSAPAPDPFGSLMSAIRSDDAVRADEVLQRHPELKARLDGPAPGARFGQTALLAAVARRNRDVIDVLLRHGANVNVRSHWWAGGFGVLDADHDLHDFLIARGAALDAYAAARLGRLDALRALLDADPERARMRGGDGQTPLHVAASVAVAELLLDRGADIDATDVDHESTSAQYLVRDHQDVAAHLVARGCRTDILLAAALGNTDVVRKHLDADPASIRTRVSEQYFPMRNPHAGGHIYTWTLGKYKSVHRVAREFGRDDVVELLMDRSPASLKLAVACELGDEPLVESLLGAVASPAPEDHDRIAAAAVNNDTPAVRLMLRAGWPTDARAQHGGTPLHWAAFHGNAEMARDLLRHRPPLEVKDDDFRATPLGWAIHGSKNGWHCRTGDYGSTVKALLAAGAIAPPFREDADASDAVREVLRRHARGG